MSATNNQSILEVNLTTDGIQPNGETRGIIVNHHDAQRVKKGLFRVGPNGTLFIVRDASGKFLRRRGKDGIGVSLPSYLYGRVYMHRVDPNEADDYSTSAFKEGGRPQAVELLQSPTSPKPSAVLYAKETDTWEKQQKALKEAKAKKKQQIRADIEAVQKPVEKPSETNSQALEQAVDSNKHALRITTEKGRIIELDTDSILRLDTERLKIIVGTA